MISKDVTAIVTLPGYVHKVELHGHPQAGQPYLLDGIPVEDILLGDPMEGCAYGAASVPRLTAMSMAELDEIIAVAQQAKERLALWFTGHEAVTA